jgi:hypothetical protein
VYVCVCVCVCVCVYDRRIYTPEHVTVVCTGYEWNSSLKLIYFEKECSQVMNSQITFYHHYYSAFTCGHKVCECVCLFPCCTAPWLLSPHHLPNARLSAYLSAILYWSIASWYSLTATRKSPRIRCRTQSLWFASALLSKAIPSSYFCSLPEKRKNPHCPALTHPENRFLVQLIYTKQL